LDKLTFVVDGIEQNSPDDGTFLFNRASHRRLQSERGWLTYKAIRQGLCGVIHFYCQNDIATSPHRAPFGSFEFQQNLNDAEMDRWWSFIQSDLRERGCKKIHIKHHPAAYAPETTRLVKQVMMSHRFQVTEETASIISITQTPFDTKLTVSKRQKLKKCVARFSFAQSSLQQLEHIYTFIATSRKAKGYQLSMSWSDMQQTVQKFPQQFLLFTVEDEYQLAAAAICIQVSDSILYTFYYAHAAAFDKLSPVTQLLQGIYEYAQSHSIKLIDLGTSQVDGKLNPSLLHFKKSVGGKSSAKYSFTKEMV
jgi:Acetyltransferase (GNAT) domain